MIEITDINFEDVYSLNMKNDIDIVVYDIEWDEVFGSYEKTLLKGSSILWTFQSIDGSNVFFDILDSRYINEWTCSIDIKYFNQNDIEIE